MDSNHDVIWWLTTSVQLPCTICRLSVHGQAATGEQKRSRSNYNKSLLYDTDDIFYTVVNDASMMLYRVGQYIKDQFQDKLIVDDRKPIYQYQYNESTTYVLFAPKNEFYHQLILVSTFDRPSSSFCCYVMMCYVFFDR
jgi:hypothetical protein